MGKKVETVTEFLFLGSKITADSECSHSIKTLVPWKKSYDKPSICTNIYKAIKRNLVYLDKADIKLGNGEF